MDPAWNVSRLKVKDYEDYVKQYGSFLSENPMHRDVVKILGVYDLIGSLLYKKLIDPDLATMYWVLATPRCSTNILDQF